MIGDRWTVLVVGALSGGPLRFSELAVRVDGVSQKMLTQTLRGLEHDGLVRRTVTAAVPVRVDYELTDTGRTLSAPLSALEEWAKSHTSSVLEAREQFAAQNTQEAPATRNRQVPRMNTSPNIAVTGCTGVLGGMVARDLAEHGIAQRLLVRTPAKAPQLPDSTVHQFSYGDKEASRIALDGVETLFMVSGPEGTERLNDHRAFVDAAASAGVKHIVYTSFIATAPDAIFTLSHDHYFTEEHIKASGMRWTFLRDNFYIDIMESFVGEDGVIRGPADDGRLAIVARADVARTAAAVLADPAPHASHTYDLTGPEALTVEEIAATIARVRGTAVRFQNETVEEAYASRAGYGVPDWQLDAWVSTYTAIASNVLSGVSTDVETITGTAPRSFETFLLQTQR